MLSDMQPNEAVGRNVARLRRDMSQADLALALAAQIGKDRIDPTTITRLEQGKRPTTVNELVALADIFGVQVEDLLSDLGSSTDADVAEARRCVDQIRTLLPRGLTQIAAVLHRVQIVEKLVARDPSIRQYLTVEEVDLIAAIKSAKSIDELLTLQSTARALKAGSHGDD